MKELKETMAIDVNNTHEKEEVTIMKTIKLVTESFIIPNRCGPIGDNLIKAGIERDLETAELNGVNTGLETPLIQLWLCNDDTENLVCHGIRLEKKSRIRYVKCEYLPAVLFEGKHEGDTVNFKCRASIVTWDKSIDDEVYEEVILDITTTLAQTKYRYKNFGTFEETFDKVS